MAARAPRDPPPRLLVVSCNSGPRREWRRTGGRQSTFDSSTPTQPLTPNACPSLDLDACVPCPHCFPFAVPHHHPHDVAPRRHIMDVVIVVLFRRWQAQAIGHTDATAKRVSVGLRVWLRERGGIPGGTWRGPARSGGDGRSRAALGGGELFAAARRSAVNQTRTASMRG
jgi:hypothetical protein